jgi:hypothetical protein
LNIDRLQTYKILINSDDSIETRLKAAQITKKQSI